MTTVSHDSTMRGRLARMRDDDGIGLILVIGITAFVTVLSSTAAIIAVNGLAGSRQRTAFEQSLASAESGVDLALAKLQRAWDTNAADYPIPGSTPVGSESAPYCQASEVTAPETFASADAERAWAKSQLATLAANHPECIKTTSSGQWLVFKPKTELVNGLYPRYGRIYSIGWSPSKATPTATRIIKSDYIFMPYRPTNAILTGANLDISASTTVSAAFGADPSVAAIHANGTVTGVGNPTAYGPVSSSAGSSFSSNRFAANPGGNVTTTPQQSIPYVDATAFYYHAPADDSNAVLSGNWFDLCPDGNARPYSSGGPCTSTTVLGSGTGGSSFRGWSYTSGTHLWTASRDTTSGAYFVYHGDVTNGTGNTAIPNISVIAAAENSSNCATKQYGNIRWDHYDMVAPMFHNLFMYADGDITTTSNFTAGSGISAPPVVSGMFVAGDQIMMETSSQGAVGSVVASDQCNTTHAPTSNQVKNPAVYFDPNADSPFTSIVTTTLWAEIQH
jgi:hypothetical protein